jgi:hypothetical protein
VLLAVVPPVLITVRWLTDSDKVVFLILWIVFMFGISAYLIGVEYLDDSIQKTLEEVTREEIGFDGLYLRPEQIQERIHEKSSERQEMLREHLEERQERLQAKIVARQENLARGRQRRQEFIAELLGHKRDNEEAENTEKTGAADMAGEDTAKSAPESGDEL